MSLCADSVSGEGADLAVSGRISVGDVLGALKAATAEEMADLMAEIWRGNEIFGARRAAAGIVEGKEVREEVAATPVKEAKAAKAEKAAKAPAAPKKAPKEKKVAVAAAVISEGEEPPTAASYRMDAAEIKADLCQARKLEGGVDGNWKPAVYRESQCKRKPVEGSELCQLCTNCFEKESQDDKFKKWFGLITEEPESTTHMLGTAWAAKCKWTPSVATAPVSAPVSVPTGTAPESAAASEGEEAEGEAPSSPPPSPALPTGTAAAPKAPAAPKAAKAPAKAPAAPKAAKAPAAKKEAPAKKEEAKPAAAAAAAAVSEPVAEAGEIMPIAGEFYWVVRGNVYEYDQIEEKPGDFVGRLRADESIDADAEEE